MSTATSAIVKPKTETTDQKKRAKTPKKATAPATAATGASSDEKKKKGKRRDYSKHYSQIRRIVDKRYNKEFGMQNRSCDILDSMINHLYRSMSTVIRDFLNEQQPNAPKVTMQLKEVNTAFDTLLYKYPAVAKQIKDEIKKAIERNDHSRKLSEMNADAVDAAKHVKGPNGEAIPAQQPSGADPSSTATAPAPKRISKAERAGITLPERRMANKLRISLGQKQLSQKALLAFTAGLEVILTMLLDLTVESVRQHKHQRIQPKDIYHALNGTSEQSRALRDLFPGKIPHSDYIPSSLCTL